MSEQKLCDSCKSQKCIDDEETCEDATGCPCVFCRALDERAEIAADRSEHDWPKDIYFDNYDTPL